MVRSDWTLWTLAGSILGTLACFGVSCVLYSYVLSLPPWVLVFVGYFGGTQGKKIAEKLLRRGKRGAPLRMVIGNANERDLAEMERGAAAWFRVVTYVEGPTWIGLDASDSRRFAAREIRDASLRAMKSLTESEMTAEDRAWLAFGLEQLADELRELPQEEDYIAVAIHNRRSVRMAEELARQSLRE